MTLIDREGDVAIIAATLGSLDAEEGGAEKIAALLGVRPPPSWPPEHNGPEMREWMRSLLRKHPDELGFASWYLIGDGEVVGTVGFKGPPDTRGSVEIGYSVVPERQRRGFASRGVSLLVARAFADPRVTVICAETLPDGLASQGVLLRCGFVPAGTRIDPDDGQVLRFERKR